MGITHKRRVDRYQYHGLIVGVASYREDGDLRYAVGVTFPKHEPWMDRYTWELAHPQDYDTFLWHIESPFGPITWGNNADGQMRFITHLDGKSVPMPKDDGTAIKVSRHFADFCECRIAGFETAPRDSLIDRLPMHIADRLKTWKM